MKKWQVISQKSVFKNQYLEILEEKCLRDQEELSSYYTVKKPDAAVVCALTKEKKVVLIRQYRHPVRTIDTELPAGYLAEGETPEQGARRELLEETGYQVGEVKKIGEAFSSAGLNSNSVHFFLAFDAIKVDDQHLDEHEDIEVFVAEFNEVLDLFNQGEIKDMGSVLGLMLARDILKF